MDEPSSALDPRQRERLWEYIDGLAGAGTTVVYATHTLSEAERYADRVLVLADGERLFWGAPAELRARGRARGGDLESAFVAFLRQRGPLRRRRCARLLAKDLRILARSPLLVALLVVYPLVVAAADRAALSRGPGQAADRVRERGAARPGVLDRRPDLRLLASRSAGCASTSSRSRSSSRAEAERMVRDGDVAGAR